MLVSGEALREMGGPAALRLISIGSKDGVLKANGISGFPVFLKSAKGTSFIQATGRHINIQ